MIFGSLDASPTDSGPGLAQTRRGGAAGVGRAVAVAALALLIAWAGAWPARAQDRPPLCSSDAHPPVRVLVERLMDADCLSCWTGTAPTLRGGELALDWVAPGAKGDGAAMSAVALREAEDRLRALRLSDPDTQTVHRTRVRGAQGQVRVAHGLALRGYVGASIEWRGSARALPLTAWLVLVEQLPKGSEGSTVARNLVRNVLVVDWPAHAGRDSDGRLRESRPLSVPSGTRADRLAVVGWVQDARGRVLGAAGSRCVPTAGQ